MKVIWLLFSKRCARGLMVRGSWKTLAQMLLRGPLGIFLQCSLSPEEEGRRGREAIGTQRRAERERETEHSGLSSSSLSSGPLSLANKKAGNCGLARAGQEPCRHGEALRVGADFRWWGGRGPPWWTHGLGERRGLEGMGHRLQS